MVKYNKLVRDKIPEIIEKQGESPKISILDDKRYIEELNKKLNEEVQEYQESKDIEELADILEVIYAICNSKGTSFEQLQKIREEKFEKRGGFSKKDISYQQGISDDLQTYILSVSYASASHQL